MDRPAFGAKRSKVYNPSCTESIVEWRDQDKYPKQLINFPFVLQVLIPSLPYPEENKEQWQKNDHFYSKWVPVTSIPEKLLIKIQKNGVCIRCGLLKGDLMSA